MKIIDILNDLSKGKTYKFKYKNDIYKFNKNKGIYESTLCNLNVYYIDLILNDEVEVIEENKEIEELHILDEGNSNKSLYEYCSRILIKQNELIRAVNKINKDLEKGQTLNIEIDEETISNAIKKARNYLEREEK